MASVTRRLLARTLRDVTAVTADELRADQNFPRVVLDPIEHTAALPVPATCQVIAIASGKGGTGKTVVTTNLAVALAREGLRVLLFDADLGLANAHLLMGVTPQHDMAAVIGGERRLQEIVVDCPEGVRLIAGGSGFSELAELRDWQLRHLASQLRALEEESDIILVDLSAGISPQVMRFLTNAHDSLLVTTPDVTALLDAYATIKCMARAHERSTVKLVINRARNEEEARGAFEKLRTVTAKHLPLTTLEFFEWIPHNWYIQNSVCLRQPVVLLHPKSFVTRAFQGMAQRLAVAHAEWKGREKASASFGSILEQTVYA